MTTARAHDDATAAQRLDRAGKLSLYKVTSGLPVFPLIVLFGLNAVDELDRVAFNVLLPEIRDAFGMSNTGVLGLVALVTPVALLMGVPIAHYADRLRRTRMAAGGAATWSLFTVMSGLAPSVLVLGISRAGAGLGRAVNGPTHNGLLADYYPPDTRAKVFYSYQLANSVGQFVGPVTAGVIAVLMGWRAAFVILAVPTMVFVALALRLREPVRGYWDRRATGADESVAEVEEQPAGLAEAWKDLLQIRSLRRAFTALPFWAVSFAGPALFMSIFWSDVYGLNEAQRGILSSATEPVQVVGLLAGAAVAQRLINRDPSLAVKGVGLVGVAQGICMLVIALSPNFVVAVAAVMVQAFVAPMLLPGISAIAANIFPPRVRSMGFTSATIFFLPGVLILPVMGRVIDSFGVRVALASVVPLYVFGSLVFASASKYVNADIAAQRAKSVAAAERERLAQADGARLDHQPPEEGEPPA